MHNNVRCHQYFNENWVNKNDNIIFNLLYSALKWKESLDDVATFMDGMRLPCLFIENKRDLNGFKKTSKIKTIKLLFFKDK